MNPGKGFQSRGGGFQRHHDRADLAEEVGEGHGTSFGISKKQQTRGAGQHAGFCDEVGEGVVSGFGISKASQTRNAGKFQDEVGEGIAGGFSKRHKRIEADYKAERVRKMPTLADPSRFKWGSEVGEGLVAMPKTVALRNPAIMDMARGRPCLLQAPYTMSHDPATTVACHGNSHQFGKAGARKANDQYTVWGCFECHSWLDQGSASQEEKLRVFHLGMFRQMLAWEQLAVSESELPKFRRAAEWALAQLEADEYDPRAALMELEQAACQGLELDRQSGTYMPVTQA